MLRPDKTINVFIRSVNILSFKRFWGQQIFCLWRFWIHKCTK